MEKIITSKVTTVPVNPLSNSPKQIIITTKLIGTKVVKSSFAVSEKALFIKVIPVR